MDSTKSDTRTFEYAVNALHSSVLGYSATSQTGKWYWDKLDWDGAYIDGGVHIFNPCGGEYLHVRVKYDPDEDGPLPCPLKHRSQYRVRCWHEIGTNWRNGVVDSVKVEKRPSGWVWVVGVKGSEHD